jgi:Mg2+ and Co2+ transporter CorA
MAVGKAEARPADRASAMGFSFTVPCVTRIDDAQIRDDVARDEFFWLDVTAPSQQDVEKLHELFGLHPVALEDALHFGQRPKLDDYGAYVFLVFYGAREHGPSDMAPLLELQISSPATTW